MKLCQTARPVMSGLLVACAFVPGLALSAPLCGTPGNLVGNSTRAAAVTTRLIETTTPGEFQLEVNLATKGKNRLIASQVGGGLAPAGSNRLFVSHLFGADSGTKKIYKTFFSQHLDHRSTSSTHLMPGTYSVADRVLIAVHATVGKTFNDTTFEAWVPGKAIPTAPAGDTYVSCTIPSFEVNDDRYLFTKNNLVRNAVFDIKPTLGVLGNDLFSVGTTLTPVEGFTWNDVKWGADLNDHAVDEQFARLDLNSDDGSFSLDYDRRPASDPGVFIGPNNSADQTVNWGEFRFKYRVTDGFGRTKVATAFVQVNQLLNIVLDPTLFTLIASSPLGTISDNTTFSIPLNIPYIVPPEPLSISPAGEVRIPVIFENSYDSNTLSTISALVELPTVELTRRNHSPVQIQVGGIDIIEHLVGCSRDPDNPFPLPGSTCTPYSVSLFTFVESDPFVEAGHAAVAIAPVAAFDIEVAKWDDVPPSCWWGPLYEFEVPGCDD